MQRIAERDRLAVLQPELGTKPRVYYKNLHLITHCFVGGSVVADVNGVEECAEGATVVLKRNGNEIGRATTDTFGEFKIDKLEKNSGEYELEISSGSSGSLSMNFYVGDKSLYLGALTLDG
jgi:hypothetical protein